ncbi:MAG: hypothetical protein NWF01_06610 [Candidatus Bathyarchaeota archaeon]|nr:hypothetical protein [Candidatus Bathyarchaeota archaeon]
MGVAPDVYCFCGYFEDLVRFQFELPAYELWDLDAVASLQGRLESDFWVIGKPEQPSFC